MTIPPDATAGGLAFHRLVYARRRSGWWTPLVVGVLGVALYAVFLAVLMAAMFAVMLVDPRFADALMRLSIDVAFDLTDPLLLAVVLGTIVLMLPAYLLASLIVNGARIGLVSSAAGRLRWRWMLLCTGLALVITLALGAVAALVPAEPTAAATTLAAPARNPNLVATLLVILLVVPLQSAAEEYVFRGYLMQAIGRWLRHPLFAILLPVPLFVLGHLYDPLGQLSVGVFAVAAGWLTWRTGGLEAAIALHVVNNLVAFLTGLAGWGDVNANAPGIASAVGSALVVGAYCAAVEVLVRRGRLPRTLVLTPPPTPSQAAMPSASRIV